MLNILNFIVNFIWLKMKFSFHLISQRYQDEHSKAYFLVKGTKRFMALYIDLVCLLFIVFVAVGALIATQDAGNYI